MRFTKESLIKPGIALAVILLLLISFITYTRTDRFLSSTRWVDHTYTVLLQLNRIMSDLKDAESNQRGFLLTNDQRFLGPYRDAITNIPHEMQTLLHLTADNPQQTRAAIQFNALAQQKMNYLQQGIQYQLQHPVLPHPAKEEILDNGRITMEEIRIRAENMFVTEKQLLEERVQKVNDDSVSTKLWIVLGNISALLMLAGTIWLIAAESRRRRIAQHKAEITASQLQITNQELESFSYSVSHDLRAPLRAIDGYSRIFEEDYASKLDEEGLRLLSVIRANSRKMGQLIDDLLQFARSGRKTIEVERVDMEQLIEEVWKEMAADYESKAVLKKSDLLPVMADRALLKQVVANLLSNALKYSSLSENPVVEVFSHQEGKRGVVYEFRDNGVGFDMKYYNKLFGVFQRLHTAEEFPGTGVGLAIVQRIIVRHGGQVWADSTIGKGSVFGFNLPSGA